ncbi:hypothetical protein D3C71_786460 [compost metagenome]
MRQPRRCIGPPPRSIEIVARPLRSDRLMRTSGNSVFTDGRSSPCERRLSTTPSLTRCAAKRAWVISVPDTCASTDRVSSGLMCCSHAMPDTPWYSEPSSGQSNSASGHSTRLARRDHSTTRSACGSSPSALTPAMVAVALSRPSASSSSASRYSKPLAQETKNFTGSVSQVSGRGVPTGTASGPAQAPGAPLYVTGAASPGWATRARQAAPGAGAGRRRRFPHCPLRATAAVPRTPAPIRPRGCSAGARHRPAAGGPSAPAPRRSPARRESVRRARHGPR